MSISKNLQNQVVSIFADVKQILDSVEALVSYDKIADFDRLDERVSQVNSIFANIVGFGDGYLEFCPNNNPPDLIEILSWYWVVRPDLGVAIASMAGQDSKSRELKTAIADYILGKLWRGYS